MSILDDAIREHLELKRAHGADEAELKKLEDEAFGPPVRPDEPDPYAEAPTEFLTAPEVGAGEQTDEESGGRGAPNIADLQEAPPAMEHETISVPLGEPEPEPEPEGEGDVADASHSTAERHAIGEQPTEIFDVEGQFEDAATEAPSPSDDELVDAEMAEPRLAPVDPLAGIDGGASAEPEIGRGDEPAAEAADTAEPAESTDEFDEFFSEQRLSDELNQALEAPLPAEPGAPVTEEGTAIYEVETDEPDSAEAEFEEDSEEHEIADSAEGEAEHDEPEAQHDEPEPESDEPPHAEPGHEDVLEDTPEFLEDAPEDDDLWFEQKPPKDIDFGD